MPINADSFCHFPFECFFVSKWFRREWKKTVYGCNLALCVSTDLTLILYPPFLNFIAYRASVNLFCFGDVTFQVDKIILSFQYFPLFSHFWNIFLYYSYYFSFFLPLIFTLLFSVILIYHSLSCDDDRGWKTAITGVADTHRRTPTPSTWYGQRKKKIWVETK